MLHGGNGIHLFVGKFDLSCVDVIDQFVSVHEIDADNVVVQFVDDVHWVYELLAFYVEINFIDPNGVHCVSRSGDAALSVGDFPGFLSFKCCVKGFAVHASDGSSCVKYSCRGLCSGSYVDSGSDFFSRCKHIVNLVAGR